MNEHEAYKMHLENLIKRYLGDFRGQEDQKNHERRQERRESGETREKRLEEPVEGRYQAR